MRSVMSALWSFVMPVVLHAQASIHGTVVDEQTGNPIAGASVTVTGTTTGTATSAAGAFTLTSDQAITSITVRSAGYETKDVAVSDATRAVHVRLSPSRTQLPAVQVIGKGAAPSTVTLSRAELQRASGLSLENSVNTVPGVFMQSRTPWGGARITIRGYYPSTGGNSPNSNGLGYQVFLNDIPVTDASGVTILDDIDYSSLGSVEIIKGPASSRYGSYIGGTVNLTTARPTPGQTSVNQQVLTGSHGLVRTNTSFETATTGSDLVLNYGHQTYDSFRPHSGSTKDYVRATGDFDVGDRQTLSAYFSYNRSFEELAGEIDSADFYARRPLSNPAYLANNSHIKINSFVAGVTDNYRIDEHFTNRTTLFGTGRTFAQPFAHGFTDATQFTFGARSAFGYLGQIGRVGVTGNVGGVLQRTNISTDGVFIIPAPPFPERPTDQENFASNWSLFTEWSFAMPQQVTLTVGASVNKNRFGIRNLLRNNQVFDTTTTEERSFDAVFTPRVTLAKGFGANTSVYASVSAGYTPPLLSNIIANTGDVNLALDPERAVQYEIGTQSTFLNDRLNVQADLFDVENADKLVSQTESSVTFTTNAGKQRNRGAEISLGYLAIDDEARPISLLRPWVSYAYTDAKFIDFKSNNNGDESTVDFSGNRVPRVPRNIVNVGLDVGTNRGVYLTGSYQYVDQVPVTFDNSTFVRSYDLLGAKLGYRRQVSEHWMLDAYTGGDNLTGNTYYSFLFIGPNIAGLAQPADGGTGDGYIIPAPYKATFYGNLSLRYTF